MGARADLGCLRQTEEGFGFADEWIGGTCIRQQVIVRDCEVCKATDN
jgi:hypothetical protein